MSTPLTSKERKLIEATLRAGTSVNATAKQVGRGASTVQRVAVAAGIAPVYAAPKQALAALADYNAEHRLNLLNRFFTKAGEMLANVQSPLELQQLSTAVAIMVDKRRLEDGQSTSRTEVHDSAARERLTSRIDELASRRRTEGAA